MKVEAREKPVHPKVLAKNQEGTETEQLSLWVIESLMDDDSFIGLYQFD